MSSDLTRAQFSSVVGRLYDCAIDPDAWPAVMEELCRLVGGFLGTLFVLDLDDQRARFGLYHGFSPEERERMEHEYSSDETILLLQKLSDPRADPNEPIVYNRFVSEEMRERSTLRRAWQERLGVCDSIGVVALKERNRMGFWSAIRHRDVGVFTDREVDIVREIAPHLRRAVTISDILDARRIEARALSETLDALHTAVAIVGEGGRLLMANSAAERQLRADGMLMSTNGVLTARSASSARGLSEALDRALRGHGAVGNTGIGLPLVNARADVAYAYILPLDVSDARTRLVPGALAAVFVTGLGETFDGLNELRVLYQLTPAELRVVEQLTKGLSVAEAAQASGIAEATVRTHLSRIFSKTGTSRQGELIAFAARLISPLSRRS